MDWWLYAVSTKLELIVGSAMARVEVATFVENGSVNSSNEQTMFQVSYRERPSFTATYFKHCHSCCHRANVETILLRTNEPQLYHSATLVGASNFCMHEFAECWKHKFVTPFSLPACAYLVECKIRRRRHMGNGLQWLHRSS